jgi:hypothetical protein
VGLYGRVRRAVLVDVEVLRLLETFAPKEVTQAIEAALSLGTIGFDAVKHLLLCRSSAGLAAGHGGPHHAGRRLPGSVFNMWANAVARV